jgi:hypothetical protein
MLVLMSEFELLSGWIPEFGLGALLCSEIENL